MFDQIKTEPIQFYQTTCPTQQITNAQPMSIQQQHHQVILQRNQISANNLHPQTTVITLHENKNNLNLVSSTAAFNRDRLSSSLSISQNQPTTTRNGNIISTLVDIKSEIISPPSSSSQSHLNTPLPQHRVVHQNSPSAVVGTRTGQTSSSTTTTTPRSSSKPQACKVCGKVLSSPSSYYVHMKLHSGSKPFQCKFMLFFCVGNFY